MITAVPADPVGDRRANEHAGPKCGCGVVVVRIRRVINITVGWGCRTITSALLGSVPVVSVSLALCDRNYSEVLANAYRHDAGVLSTLRSNESELSRW